jgi:hypothetical protein
VREDDRKGAEGAIDPQTVTDAPEVAAGEGSWKGGGRVIGHLK